MKFLLINVLICLLALSCGQSQGNISKKEEPQPKIEPIETHEIKKPLLQVPKKTKEYTDQLVKKALGQSGDVFSLRVSEESFLQQIYDVYMVQSKPIKYKADINAKGLNALINDVILKATDLGIAENLFLDFDLWQPTSGQMKRFFGGKSRIPVGPLPFQIVLRMKDDDKTRLAFNNFKKAMKTLAQTINIDWEAYVKRSIKLMKAKQLNIDDENLQKLFDI